MNERVYLVHGWTGRTDKDWFPWAKDQLTKKGYEVFLPEMPDTDNPVREVWIEKLHGVIGNPRPSDILVGHSLGGVAVLRYLETLGSDQKVAKAILIAPALIPSKAAIENENDEKIVKDWLSEPIDYGKVKLKAVSFTTVLSSTDPWVLLGENKKLIEDKLGGEIIVKEGMGHFCDEHGVREIPFLLELL
jgi:uncharacterized protein